MAGWLVVLVIGIPWLGALLVWLASDARPKLQHFIAVLFSVSAGIVSLILFSYASSQAILFVSFAPAFGDLTFVPDGLGVSLTAISAVIGSLAVLFSVNYMHAEKQLGRYYFLVLFFIGAMNGLVLSGNFLFIFFFWEITALCSYALISFHNDDPKAVAGGMKALIITQVGGVGLLTGALIAFVNTGSLQVSALLSQAAEIPLNVLSVIAFSFLIAAAAKSAQFPFHTWLPDAMEAPTPVSALIHAATMVNAGVYLLARFYPAFAPVPGWKTAVMLVGLISALTAALMACTTTDLKRTLAYSTVSQLGYMVYAIGVGSVTAAQFHLLSHSIFKALLFLSAGAIIHSIGTRDMLRMGGLSAKMPFVRNTFIVGALALMGLPILNGFWSKELILEMGFEHSPLWAYALMLLGAGLTAFYTFRMTWLVFFGEQRAQHEVHAAGMAMKISLGLLSFGAFTSWLAFGGLNNLLSRTLPFHELEQESTLDVVQALLSAPTTWLALLTIFLGCGIFWFVRKKSTLASKPSLVLDSSFGLESVNGWIVRSVQALSKVFQITQMGQLNWNIFGIVGALLGILLVLWWGAS